MQLKPAPRARGFSLIELMVALTIMAILVTLAMPLYRDWLANTQIRNATESISSGIRLTQAEAIKRNGQVEFRLTPATGWEVRELVDDTVVQQHLFTSGSRNVTVVADAGRRHRRPLHRPRPHDGRHPGRRGAPHPGRRHFRQRDRAPAAARRRRRGRRAHVRPALRLHRPDGVPMNHRVHRARPPAPARQRGGFLLEALVGILIFSFGILGLVGLQANAIRHVNDAQYRGEAVYLASTIVGRMWTDNLAQLEANYDTVLGGPGYLALKELVKTLPGATIAGNEPDIQVVPGPRPTAPW